MRLKLNKLLGGWFRLTKNFSGLIIAAFVLLATASLFYTVNNLRMNTDTRDMLSPELSWRQLDLEYERLFPHTVDDLVIILEAATPDQAADAARDLYARLKADRKNFKTVFSYSQQDFIRESGLLFLEPTELQDLADQLATNQPFLARLMDDQNLRGFSDMLIEALEAKADGEDIDLAPVLQQFTRAMQANRRGDPYRVSWQKLLFDETDKAVYREFIIVQPVLDYSSMLPAADSLETIRAAAASADIKNRYGAELRLTGGVALSHEELQSVMQTNTTAILAALVLVAIILIVGLGSAWMVLATLLTLVTGLVLTAGFATLTVGELNLISVAFAVLYIGLGVDFAIHFCLRYREQLANGHAAQMALNQTMQGVGDALIICAVTTAIGFYAFIPTDYDGVAELGWISGSGMFISLVTTLTFLPAVLKYLPVKRLRITPRSHPVVTHIHRLPQRHNKWVLVISALALVASIFIVRDLRFDSNTLNLQPPDNPSVKAFRDLLNEPGDSPLTGKIVAQGATDAKETRDKIEALPLVDKVVWLDDFIPDNQEEKLLLIDEMNLLLGSGFFDSTPQPVDTQTRLDALQRLSNTVNNSLSLPTTTTLEDFRLTLNKYLSFTQGLNGAELDNHLKALEHSLLGSLPGRLQALEVGLQTTGLARAEIPESFTNRWKNGDHYLLEIYPDQELQDDAAQFAFVEQIQAVDDRVTGGPVITVEAGKAVITAFTQAFVSAILVIALLLLLLMPRRMDVIYVLTPLLLAALLTAAISVVAGIPLNFANVIALPLLLGIGVDSAIHIIHRFRTRSDDDNLLATSSARAILISALTTIGSIGNLAFSPHVGTASMGMLLTIGISMALVTTLFMLPSLLEYNNK